MIAALIYSVGFDREDQEVADELGLPLINYKSRKSTLLEFLEDNEFSEKAYAEWIAEQNSADPSGVFAESGGGEVQTPSIMSQAKSFYKATKEHVKSGCKNVSPELLAERNKICDDCGLIGTKEDGWMENRCKACGCYMLVKAKWATEHCIRGKW